MCINNDMTVPLPDGASRSEDGERHMWTMQPEVQTTTRGFLAVSACALEMAGRYSRRLRDGGSLFKAP